MRRLFNIISGIVLGSAPIVGFGFIGLVVYAGYSSVLGGVFAALLFLLGIWIGLSIYKKIQIVGPIEVMSALRASPDLDNLIPQEGDETKFITTTEYVNSIKANKNLFKGGAIRIYGDWFGKPYQNEHKLIGADYDTREEKLIIRFYGGEVLTIIRPRNIFEASTFMKVLDAERIKFEWKKHDQTLGFFKTYFLIYNKSKSKIETSTNIDWYKPKFDTSLAGPAIVIFGRFDKVNDRSLNDK